MPKDCVIFDLRGTLTERKPAHSFLGAAAHHEGAATLVVGGARRCLKTARQLKRKVTDRQLIPDAFKQAVWTGISKLDPEAAAILRVLREERFTALLSNDPPPLGERAVKYNGITELFDIVRFSKNRDEAKPNPVGLQAIISEICMDDGITFMVGDRASDMLVAFNAAQITGRSVIPIARAPDTEAALYLGSLSSQSGHVLEHGLPQLPDLIRDITR